MLFVHGTGTHRLLWEPTVERLDGALRAVNYDRRGFGESVESEAGSLQDHVDDMAVLVAELELAPVVLVAQSGAGPIGLAFAAQHPDSVRELVLAEPAYEIIRCRPSGAAFMASLRLNYQRRLRRDPHRAVLGYYRWATRYVDGGNSFDLLPEEWRRRALEPGHVRATLAEVDRLFRPWPARAALAPITCPVTVAIGDSGEPAFHRSSERVLRALPEARRVHIPGHTSHLLFWDQPQAFAAQIGSN